MQQPRLVEVQRLDVIADVCFSISTLYATPSYVLCVSDRMRGRLFFASREQVGLDLLLDVLRPELLLRNRTDDAEVVARGREEHGDRARHRDGVQDRHVAVAVDDHDVVRRHGRVPDHLVRRRRAIGHEEAVIGIEDARGVALGGEYRARMVEQLAELVDRVADVGAQHVLAEELVEHLADRTPEERDAARVSRAMPRVRAVLRVVDERKNGGASESR